MLTYQPKITFDDVRASGVRDVLIYCRDHKCSHRITISADAGPITSGRRTSNRGSSAPPVASAARKCGRSFRRPEWGGPVETRALVHQICPRQRFAAIRQ